MAGITGMGTTFNLPNFVGELFETTPTDTPLLSAIGGLTGGKATASTEFQWQTVDLREAGQNTKKEGEPAPDGSERARTNVSNIVQIHQEATEVSYAKQAATGNYSGLNIAGTNPVQNELAAQTTLKNYMEGTRNVGGVNLKTIETDFGTINIMLNRHMPVDQLAVVSMEMLTPMFLEIPGKGHMFVEPTAKVGASDKYQIYEEIGLEYGNEIAHGKITGIKTA